MKSSRARRIIIALAASLVVLVAGVWLLLRIRYGGGEAFVDLTTAPVLPETALEVVADLPLPPGNIAVSPTGRVFFSFHPEGSPMVKVAEWTGDQALPYPDASWQSKRPDAPWFDSVLSLRIDQHNRLWTLDHGAHGSGQPRLLAFDLSSGELAHHFEFPSDAAPLGSHLNDFQVSADGKWIYIADASIFRKSPALVVYDVEKKIARRVLEGHPSVEDEPFVPVVGGRPMRFFGAFVVRPGVDSIALDRRDEWLYYAAVTSTKMYRVPAADLRLPGLPGPALASKVETFADKTMSDGITMDLDDNIYISDLEHSAVVTLGADGRLTTVLKTPMLRWPDGFSFGPSGWLYVTCSALNEVIMHSSSDIAAAAPYQILRFKPGTAGIPGH